MLRYSDNSMSITDQSLVTYEAGSGVLTIGMYNFIGPILSGAGNMTLSGTVIGKIG